jgi:hypothetical protein
MCRPSVPDGAMPATSRPPTDHPARHLPRAAAPGAICLGRGDRIHRKYFETVADFQARGFVSPPDWRGRAVEQLIGNRRGYVDTFDDH